MDNLIYDWNNAHDEKQHTPLVELCDETLRDGLQSPSVFDPDSKDKLKLIDLMASLKITIADIGLPGAGPRAFTHVLEIAKYVKNHGIDIKLNCAARTLKQDIEPIARIQNEAGINITAYCFLGCSPIRRLVEDWSIDKLCKTITDALSYAKQEGLSVAFVTEDTTRTDKETLELLFKHAISLGSERLVLCDTVGHADGAGVKNLIGFTKDVIKETKSDVKIDWHGHNDRGFGVSNALAAYESGCHRIHGTALGIGERVGNTSLDQLIVNLKLMGAYPHDVSALVDYVELVKRACKIDIPNNYPVFGKDAFCTATGVHAAAVIKAKRMQQEHLSDIIYSSVPAHWFGKKQIIEIGPMSGASNVRHWLDENDIEVNQGLILAIINYAKNKAKTLSPKELHEIVYNYDASLLPKSSKSL